MRKENIDTREIGLEIHVHEREKNMLERFLLYQYWTPNKPDLSFSFKKNLILVGIYFKMLYKSIKKPLSLLFSLIIIIIIIIIIFFFFLRKVSVGANWSHRYCSHGKGLGLWPNTQSEDNSVSEDDQQRKKWKLYSRKR